MLGLKNMIQLNVDKIFLKMNIKLRKKNIKKQQYYTDMVAKLEKSNKQLGANTITPEEWTKKMNLKYYLYKTTYY